MLIYSTIGYIFSVEVPTLLSLIIINYDVCKDVNEHLQKVFTRQIINILPTKKAQKNSMSRPGFEPGPVVIDRYEYLYRYLPILSVLFMYLYRIGSEFLEPIFFPMQMKNICACITQSAHKVLLLQRNTFRIIT